MKPKTQSQSSQVKGSKPKTAIRFLDKLSVKLLKCFCLVPYCGETNVKNALGDSIFAQENQAIEQQKLKGGISRQIQNVKPQQPLLHKSKPGLSSGNSNSSVANKTHNEETKVYVRESAAPTPSISMVNMMKKFQSSTRDLSLPSLSHGKHELMLTRPKEPEFETAQRDRSVKFADLEEEMMTKTPKFKARPVNEKIFEAPTLLALPRSAPQLPKFKKFHFETTSQWKPHHLTEPKTKSPLLGTTLRARPPKVKSSLELEEETETIPKFKERGAKKERKFMMELAKKQREEERARAPKANQYPYTTDFCGIPPKLEPKPCTQPEPFQLEILVRHEEEMQRQMDKGLRIEKEEEEKRIFRAQPILKKDPIPVPERVRKPQTQVQQFFLRVDHRAVDRAECDQKVKEKEHLHKRYRQERETARMIEEDKAVKELRPTMVPRARLMPYFDHPFRPKKSAKAATKAKSPNLQVLRRKQRQDYGKCNLQPRFIHDTIDLSFGGGSFRFLDYLF